MKTVYGLSPARKAASVPAASPAAAPRPSPISETSYPTQVEIGTSAATGAAVESTRYASFSRDTFSRSVIGRMVLPTTSVFA